MYNIEQLSILTGLTTRTLRNYLKSDILQGSKDSGTWQFTEQQVSAFVCHPLVCPSIRAKQHSIVYDFLASQDSTKQEMCILLDRIMEEADAKKLADFFCHAVNRFSHIRFAFSYKAGKAHYILKGSEDDVRVIMQEFYSR